MFPVIDLYLCSCRDKERITHIGFILKKIFVGNLPADADESSVKTLFSAYGKVHSINLVCDIFTGNCKGFGYIGMEGHEARIAVAELSGKKFGANLLKVGFDSPASQRGRRR